MLIVLAGDYRPELLHVGGVSGAHERRAKLLLRLRADRSCTVMAFPLLFLGPIVIEDEQRRRKLGRGSVEVAEDRSEGNGAQMGAVTAAPSPP